MKQIAVTAVEDDPIYLPLLELLKEHLGTGGTHTLSEVPDRVSHAKPLTPPEFDMLNEFGKCQEIQALWDELAASPDARRYLKLIAAHCETNGRKTFAFDDLFPAWGEDPNTMYAANRRVGKAIKKVLGEASSPFAKKWNSTKGRMEFTVGDVFLEYIPAMRDED